MSQVSRTRAIQLAQSLPPRLQYFFKKWPTPAIIEASSSQINDHPTSSSSTTPLDNSNTINSDATTISQTLQTLPRSPFDAYLDPATGKWQPPFYSLRRQADLMKLAHQHGVEELMPFSIKGTAERQRKREENGLRIKGTGVGQRVKGKEWERTLKGRLEKRRQAMLEMPQMIRSWKERGHGRGWKKWPK